MLSALSLALAAPQPNDDTAREWAQHELAKNKYHSQKSLVEWIIEWLQAHLQIKIGHFSAESSATIVITILAVLAAAVIAWLLIRFAKIRQAGAARDKQQAANAVLFDDVRSSAQLLKAGAAARARGDFSQAVIEYFRAVIRLLAEHSVIAVRPGLTATEAALESSAAIGYRSLFMPAAAAFNRVYFADAPASEQELIGLMQLIAIAQEWKPPQRGSAAGKHNFAAAGAHRLPQKQNTAAHSDYPAVQGGAQ